MAYRFGVPRGAVARRPHNTGLQLSARPPEGLRRPALFDAAAAFEPPGLTVRRGARLRQPSWLPPFGVPASVARGGRAAAETEIVRLRRLSPRALLISNGLGHRMAPTPPPRTRQQLRTAVTHIAYEAEALRRAVGQLNRPHRRLVIEAALLHARNLTEFFWAPSRRHKPHADGVYAIHYVPNWTRLRGALPQRPNQRYKAMCAQLAHISVRRSDRRNVVNFGAALPGLSTDLECAWGHFRTALRGTGWALLFRRAEARWRRAR